MKTPAPVFLSRGRSVHDGGDAVHNFADSLDGLGSGLFDLFAFFGRALAVHQISGSTDCRSDRCSGQSAGKHFVHA